MAQDEIRDTIADLEPQNVTKNGDAVKHDSDSEPTKPAGQESGSLIAAQVSELLTRHGYKTFRHVSLLADVLGISGHAARRRISGATPYTEDELQALLAFLKYEYRGLEGIVKTGELVEHETVAHPKRAGAVGEMTVELNGAPMKAHARLRAVKPWARAANSTFAVKTKDGQYVLRHTSEIGENDEFYAISSIEITAPFRYEGTGASVAVLDENAETALAVAAALNNAGFRTAAVSNLEDLTAGLATNRFDAFVVSWESWSSWKPDEIAKLIRSSNSAAPIIFSGPFAQDSAATTLAALAVKYDAILLSQLSSTSIVAMTLLRELRGHDETQDMARNTKQAVGQD